MMSFCPFGLMQLSIEPKVRKLEAQVGNKVTDTAPSAMTHHYGNIKEFRLSALPRLLLRLEF